MDLGAVAETAGVTGFGNAWATAGREYYQTQTVKFTCINQASSCANMAPPQNTDIQTLLTWAQGNGVKMEFMDAVPKGANNIATNGILNTAVRGGQFALGLESDDLTGQANGLYLQYNFSAGPMSDLVGAGWNKFISKSIGDYSATVLAYANAVLAQGPNAAMTLYGHSGGTIVQSDALYLLAQQGYTNTNPQFQIVSVGPAVAPGTLADPLRTITQLDSSQSFGPRFTYLNSPNDPVANWVGGMAFPWSYQPYDDPNTPAHIQGVSPGNWSSNPVSSMPAHSCYVLNCVGTPYNWTVEQAEQGAQQRHPQQGDNP